MEIDTTAEQQARETERANQSAESRVNRLLSELRKMTIEEEQLSMTETSLLDAEAMAEHQRNLRAMQTRMSDLAKSLSDARVLLDALSSEKKKLLVAEKEKAKDEALFFQQKQKAIQYFMLSKPDNLIFKNNTNALQFMEGFLK
ncbi:MAG: hypothetical protein RJA90_2235, partial [Bacteroidota bacterium]